MNAEELLDYPIYKEEEQEPRVNLYLCLFICILYGFALVIYIILERNKAGKGR
jgi:hypothetical protein